MPSHRLRNTEEYKKILLILSNLNLDLGWVVDIKRYVKKRTNPQNNLYWKWMTIIGNEFGTFPKETSQKLKEHLLTPEDAGHSGMEVKRYKSTADMDVKEISSFMKDIEMFVGSEYGIALPHPSDQHYEVR